MRLIKPVLFLSLMAAAPVYAQQGMAPPERDAATHEEEARKGNHKPGELTLKRGTSGVHDSEAASDVKKGWDLGTNKGGVTEASASGALKTIAAAQTDYNSAAATPRDIYKMVSAKAGGHGGPVTTPAKSQAGVPFDLTVTPDGSVSVPPKVVAKLLGPISAQPDQGSAGSHALYQDVTIPANQGAAQPAVGARVVGLRRIPVLLPDGTGFDIEFKLDGNGQSAGMLLPAVQKVREAAAR